jgi:antitoxin Phd
MKAVKSRGKATRPRTRQEQGLGTSSVTATVAKNNFGRLLEQAIQGRPVIITKNDRPRAVLMSIEGYDALAQAEQDALTALRTEFDAMLARMQTPRVRAAVQAALEATPEEIGQAAVAAARKRG